MPLTFPSPGAATAQARAAAARAAERRASLPRVEETYLFRNFAEPMLAALRARIPQAEEQGGRMSVASEVAMPMSAFNMLRRWSAAYPRLAQQDPYEERNTALRMIAERLGPYLESQLPAGYRVDSVEHRWWVAPSDRTSTPVLRARLSWRA